MTDREKCCLEGVKVLSRGMPKGGHVGEERLDMGWFERLEKDIHEHHLHISHHGRLN